MSRRHAFALVELVICLTMATVLSLHSARDRGGAPATSHGRRAPWPICTEFAAITSSYARGQRRPVLVLQLACGCPHGERTYPDLAGPPADQTSAAAMQAVDLLRRHGRPDMPVMSGWLPLALYSSTCRWREDYLGVDSTHHGVRRLTGRCEPASLVQRHRRLPRTATTSRSQPDPTDPTSRRRLAVQLFVPWLPLASFRMARTRSRPGDGTIVPSTSTQFYSCHRHAAVEPGRAAGVGGQLPIAEGVRSSTAAQWQGVKIPVFFGVRVRARSDELRRWERPRADQGTGQPGASSRTIPAPLFSTTLPYLARSLGPADPRGRFLNRRR